MARVGWILLFTAIVAGPLINVFDRENVWLLSVFGITLVLGTVILASTFVVRLYRGNLKLRPWDAAKSAFRLFMIVLALRLLASAVFRSTDFDLAETILMSAVFAIVAGLYTTAYRKPA